MFWRCNSISDMLFPFVRSFTYPVVSIDTSGSHGFSAGISWCTEDATSPLVLAEVQSTWRSFRLLLNPDTKALQNTNQRLLLSLVQVHTFHTGQVCTPLNTLCQKIQVIFCRDSHRILCISQLPCAYVFSTLCTGPYETRRGGTNDTWGRMLKGWKRRKSTLPLDPT